MISAFLSRHAINLPGPSFAQTEFDGPTAKWCACNCRASTDSQGTGRGIWRERYQGVRASAMLLALHNLNRHLKSSAVEPQDGNPSKPYLLTAFQAMLLLLLQLLFCLWLFPFPILLLRHSLHAWQQISHVHLLQCNKAMGAFKSANWQQIMYSTACLQCIQAVS